MSEVNINWFPGHMAKAIREIKEKVNIVDIVIELVDARAPLSSINPVVKEVIGNKYYLKVFTKIDLADDYQTKKWEKYYASKNIATAFVNLNQKSSMKQIAEKIKEVTLPIALKDKKRGLKPRSVRVMVLGIPNVGKSTFINSLSKRKSAGVGNIPGFTKAQKWVHCEGFELLDTPGILWPNLSENNTGVKLALIGCVKQDILPILDLARIGLDMLNKNYSIEEKYQIKYDNFNTFIQEYAKKRGHLLKENELDIQRSAISILNDIKNGYFGKITLERVDDING